MFAILFYCYVTNFFYCFNVLKELKRKPNKLGIHKTKIHDLFSSLSVCCEEYSSPHSQGHTDCFYHSTVVLATKFLWVSALLQYILQHLFKWIYFSPFWANMSKLIFAIAAALRAIALGKKLPHYVFLKWDTLVSCIFALIHVNNESN